MVGVYVSSITAPFFKDILPNYRSLRAVLLPLHGQRLGFDIDAVYLRVCAAQVGFDAADRLVHLLCRGACNETHPHIHEQIVRSHVHREDIPGALDRQVRLYPPPDVRELVGVHALAQQQAVKGLKGQIQSLMD